MREFQVQGAEFREVLLGAPAEFLEEFFVLRVVRQIHREPADRLGESLDDQTGGSGRRLLRCARNKDLVHLLNPHGCLAA